MPIVSFLSYRRPSSQLSCLAAALATLSACASSGETYAGKLEPEAGVCDTGHRATLQRHGANLQFTPQDGVLTLDGTVAASGQLSAAQQTLGMDRKPYRLSFTGTLAGNEITGTYVTPRCRYKVTLHAVGS